MNVTAPRTPSGRMKMAKTALKRGYTTLTEDEIVGRSYPEKKDENRTIIGH